jgi:flagellar protein FliO/FliZ
MACSLRRRWLAVVLIFVWLTGFSGLAGAAEQSAPAPAPSTGYLQYQEPARAAGSTWGTVAYVMSLLVLFVGVIFLAYLTSRFVASRMGGIGQTAGAVIHMTLALGPNRNIHLVEMAGRFFVVGATEHSIQMLFEINEPEQIEKIRETTTVARPSFEAALGGQLAALKQMRDKFPDMFSPPQRNNSDDHEKR